jgi:hypothetical protein
VKKERKKERQKSSFEVFLIKKRQHRLSSTIQLDFLKIAKTCAKEQGQDSQNLNITFSRFL